MPHKPFHEPDSVTAIAQVLSSVPAFHPQEVAHATKFKLAQLSQLGQLIQQPIGESVCVLQSFIFGHREVYIT